MTSWFVTTHYLTDMGDVLDTALQKFQTEFAAAYSRFFQIAARLKPGQRDQAGVCGEWSPKDVIAHLIGWDKSLQTFIADPDGFDPAPLYDANTFNATSVTERQHLTWDEIVAELESNFIALQQALVTVTPEMKIYSRVVDWVKGRTEDYALHAGQLEAWLK